MNELKHLHQSEINNLQALLTQKDEYIEELEEELEESEGELNGLQEESTKEKETPFGEIVLGRVLVQAGENLLKSNPKILKIGLGLSDEEVKRIFSKEQEQLGTGKANDSSSFSETQSDNDFAGLDEKHIQGIKDLNQFFKQLNVSDFKKLYTIDCLLQDTKTGMLNIDLADRTLQFVNENTKNS
jgi:sugar-specific transcriptional regulator TrmB